MNSDGMSCLDVMQRLFRVDIARTAEDIAEAQRLRYQVYCREHDFLSGEGGYEYDEYDGRSFHVLLRRRTGEVVGTVRLVTAMPGQPESSFPMQHVCRPNLLAGLPIDKTGEISRFAISRQRRDMDSRTDMLLRLALMRGVLEASLEAGITHWCAVMENSLLRLLRQASVRFDPIGPAIEYKGLRQPAIANIGQILSRGEVERPEFWSYVTDGGRLAVPELGYRRLLPALQEPAMERRAA